MDYYNEAAKICGKIYKELKELIQTELNNSISVDVLKISQYGNKRIVEETSKIHKKNKNKGIASPVSISLNNCIGNYIYDESYGNIIVNNDVVKIDFSVSVCECIATIGETFIAGTEKEKNNENLSFIQKSINFLDSLKDEIAELMIDGETNDEIKIMIESKCTECNVFPIENCMSYQQFEGNSRMIDSKYIMLNHTKYWDDNDNLVTEENTCFELLKDEVYTINLTVIPEETEGVKYIDKDDCHLYKFNDNHYQLKLKSSRAFFSEVKAKYLNYTFDIREFNKNVKHRMGINECFDNGIIEKYPITFVLQDKTLNKIPVISKKFTIIVKNKKSYVLKY